VIYHVSVDKIIRIFILCAIILFYYSDKAKV
jgi:hypothetical protein